MLEEVTKAEVDEMIQSAGSTGTLPAANRHGEERGLPRLSWLIKNLLKETGVSLLAGQWGTVKTFGALDIASSLMPEVNQEFFIDYRIKRRGGVLFIAAEGASSIRLRFEVALANKLGRSALDWDNPDQPFAHIDFKPQILQKGAGDLIAIALREAAWMKEKFGCDLVLIVIDSVAAAAAFQREDDAAQGQTVMNAFDELSKATGAHVLGVDHFGKDVDTGTRGTSAKEGAADTVLAMIGKREVTGSVTDLRMGLRKIKDGDTGRVIPFRTETVNCGVDEDGDQITTCVIHWEPDRKVGRVGRPRKDHALILQAINLALIKEAKTFDVDGISVLAATRGAVHGKFKELIKDADKELTDNVVKQRWKRAFKKSREELVVGVMPMDALSSNLS
jgi:ribosomal protein S28E/S33